MPNSRFYFRAQNTIDRIRVGDVVLVDRKATIDNKSVILTDRHLLERADGYNPGHTLGKVVGLRIPQ